MSTPPNRNPPLPSMSKPVGYIDVFVNNSLGPSQGRGGDRRVWKILLHAIDNIIHHLGCFDGPCQKESVSLKKLRQGNCSWSTIKTMLDWIIDTVNMTIHCPVLGETPCKYPCLHPHHPEAYKCMQVV